MKFREMPGNEGLEVIDVISDSELPDRLLEVLSGCDKRNYTFFSVIPGIVATAETEFRFDLPVHVVYGRLSKPGAELGAKRPITNKGLVLRSDGTPFTGSYNDVL